jgi:hypothetical protein
MDLLLMMQINEINMPEVNRMFSELGVGSGGTVSTPKMDFSPISDVASCTASPANDLASWEARGKAHINKDVEATACHILEAVCVLQMGL